MNHKILVTLFSLFLISFSGSASAATEYREFSEFSMEQKQALANEFVPYQAEITEKLKTLEQDPRALQVQAAGQAALKFAKVDSRGWAKPRFLFCVGGNVAIILVLKGSECWDSNGESYFMIGLAYSSNSVRGTGRASIMVDFGAPGHKIAGSYLNAEGEISLTPIGGHIGVLAGFERDVGMNFLIYGGVSVGGGIPSVEGGYLYAVRTPFLDIQIK